MKKTLEKMKEKDDSVRPEYELGPPGGETFEEMQKRLLEQHKHTPVASGDDLLDAAMQEALKKKFKK